MAKCIRHFLIILWIPPTRQCYDLYYFCKMIQKKYLFKFYKRCINYLVSSWKLLYYNQSQMNQWTDLIFQYCTCLIVQHLRETTLTIIRITDYIFYVAQKQSNYSFHLNEFPLIQKLNKLWHQLKWNNEAIQYEEDPSLIQTQYTVSPIKRILFVCFVCLLWFSDTVFV